ncbi:TetR/AcrR family transcriptional regulator [Microlunatus flavus]|uniref:DNA-binding transcriptional regulator, AcrR family n=1 Tax=Microlunatus flavus TaxID=1036181 RepID=A0A1H9K7A9_9ACTN|nr:TetR/AcrR family transcriptional regulator [Microlunatus flavus]SEQ94803.1 DNA-binding transcriptional regulator, AcrR family [Microlunatus flavus]
MVRSDAQQNRERILEVARELFAGDGSTSMNQVAQRAGVGAGTLYRHFATREALVLAVYEAEVDRVVGTVPQLLEEHPPLEALRAWTADLVEVMRRKHGLGDALGQAAREAASERAYGPVVAAIASMLDAGAADGSIRADADAGDFLQLTAGMWRAPGGADDRSGRMLALVLDGLRGPARTAPPARAQEADA